jgi:hypothetical protein
LLLSKLNIVGSKKDLRSLINNCTVIMIPHSTDNNFMSFFIDKIYFNVKIQMIFELAM